MFMKKQPKQVKDWEKEAQEWMDKLRILDVCVLNNIVFNARFEAKEELVKEIKEWVKKNKNDYKAIYFDDLLSYLEKLNIKK